MYHKIEILAEKIVDYVDYLHEKYHFIISLLMYFYLGSIMFITLQLKIYILSLILIIIPVTIYYIARKREKRDKKF
jgi:hypothetical protein